MIANAFSGWHLIVVLFLVLLLFGAPKLPALAKSLGQSMNILKKEVRDQPEHTGHEPVRQSADLPDEDAKPDTSGTHSTHL